MLKLDATCEGKTLNDLLMAIDEMRSRVSQEYTSGFDKNEDGNFSFDVSGEEEVPEE